MATIKNFLYCLGANTQEGRVDIDGVLSAMVPEYIPGLFSFSINFTVMGMDEGKHQIKIKFKNPEGDVLAFIDSIEIDYRNNIEQNLPEEYSGLNITVGLQNVDFKKSGVYFTEVSFDGDVLGTYDIFAKGRNEK